MLRKTWHPILMALALAVLPAPSMAQNLDQAARQAASQNDAKVLSARTLKEGDKKVHEIKLLTRDGVVKIVRIPVREKKSK